MLGGDQVLDKLASDLLTHLGEELLQGLQRDVDVVGATRTKTLDLVVGQDTLDRQLVEAGVDVGEVIGLLLSAKLTTGLLVGLGDGVVAVNRVRIMQDRGTADLGHPVGHLDTVAVRVTGEPIVLDRQPDAARSAGAPDVVLVVLGVEVVDAGLDDGLAPALALGDDVDALSAVDTAELHGVLLVGWNERVGEYEDRAETLALDVGVTHGVRARATRHVDDLADGARSGAIRIALPRVHAHGLVGVPGSDPDDAARHVRRPW